MLMCEKWVVAALVLAVSATALPAQDKGPVPSVQVVAVAARDVTPQFRYVGRIEAVDRVEIRARVEGVIETRAFREGAEVKAGDLLFVIEKAPYEVVVAQRQADLAGARATLENAESDFVRKQSLVKRKTVSEASLDQARAAAGLAQAQVLQAEAALKSAQLDLSYTEIYSPIAGKIGQAQYSVGNLVNPTSEPLAIITSVDPVYATIAVSERQLLDVRRRGIDLQDPPVAPSLVLSDGSSYGPTGAFDFLSPDVNRSTDTITARAVFPNPDRILWPGQFVTVIVRQKVPESALVIPQASVQKDQAGYFALVVNRADKVEVRRVEMGARVETDWVVTSGLSIGERVILQGLQKVRPDMVVNAVSADGS